MSDLVDKEYINVDEFVKTRVLPELQPVVYQKKIYPLVRYGEV